MPSRSQPWEWHRTENNWCDCKGFQFNGRCAHIEALRVAEETFA